MSFSQSPDTWQDAQLVERAERAVSAVQFGFSVIPLNAPTAAGCTCGEPDCKSPGKHPLQGKWPEKGLSDPTKVARLWAGTDLGILRESNGLATRVAPPTSPNVGILTGGDSNILVLDVDPRNGGDETLHDLERGHGPLPDTVQCLTGSGGWHYYFRLDAGVMVPSGVLGKGLDIKAHRGFVVAPGSLHSNGFTYEWEVEHHPEDLELAPAPAWLLKTAVMPKSPYPRPSKRPPMARPDQQEEFRERWSLLGIDLDPVKEQHYLCPFHKEKTASLHIHPGKATWYCFGCGRGGGLRDLRDAVSSQPVTKNQVPDCDDTRKNPLLPDPSAWPRPALPSERCGGVGQVHRKRANRGRHRGVHPLCKEWACNVCGPYAKLAWRESLLDCVASGDGMLHLALVEPNEWGAVKKRIERSGEENGYDYVRFDFTGVETSLGTSTYVVIGTEPEGLGISRDEARHLLVGLLAALPFDEKRIETTTAWEKRRHMPSKSGEWEMVRGDLGPDLKPVAEYFERRGMSPSGLKPLRGPELNTWGVGFEFTVPKRVIESNAYSWVMQACVSSA